MLVIHDKIKLVQKNGSGIVIDQAVLGDYIRT